MNVEPFRINSNDLKFIDPEFHAELKKSALVPGDIVIVRTGKPGACAVIPDWIETGNCSDVVIVRASQRLRPRYASYVINSTAKHHIHSHTVGAVQQHFNVAAARKIRFCLPPVRQQDRIIDVLGAIEDKIELNRRMNETLESMARAIFKDWFIDFGPTRAKLNGHAAYLAPDIWARFPDRLDDEDKPEGWENATLASMIRISSGGTPKTSIGEYWEGDIPWFSVVDAPSDADIFVLDTQKHISEAGLHNSPASMLSEGATIITARGTVGKLAIVGTGMAMNQSCYAITGGGKLGSYGTYFLLKRAIGALQANTHGSVFDTITRQTFNAIAVVRAREDILATYESVAAPLMDRIKANGLENRTLAATRDLLLPKLMSGEVSIRDAEAMVAAAA